MKKKLNLITLFIGIAVGISLYNTIKEDFYDLKSSFLEGINESNAMVMRNNNSPKIETVSVTLEPKVFSAMPDSIFDRKTETWLPSRIIRTEICAPAKDNSMLKDLWMFPISIMGLAGFFMIPFNFYLIIRSVNKSVIFAWINVKRLRRIGIGFLLYFAAEMFARMYTNSLRMSLFDVENYNIVTSTFDGSILMYGMITFLVAEIFAVGLRLKEEQDLTI